VVVGVGVVVVGASVVVEASVRRRLVSCMHSRVGGSACDVLHVEAHATVSTDSIGW